MHGWQRGERFVDPKASEGSVFFFIHLISIKIMNYNNNSNVKISWVQIVNAVIQAAIAALTALGVSSCTNIL